MQLESNPQVSIVPVIAKSDCLTMTEIKKLKQRILEEIHANGIRIYRCSSPSPLLPIPPRSSSPLSPHNLIRSSHPLFHLPFPPSPHPILHSFSPHPPPLLSSLPDVDTDEDEEYKLQVRLRVPPQITSPPLPPPLLLLHLLHLLFPSSSSSSSPQVAQLRESIPFAVCGANAMVEVAGKKVRICSTYF